MKFRPCIDIHNGAVKQIVGGTLSQKGGDSTAKDNFVSSEDAAYYANLYKEAGLVGGHIIMLNSPKDESYDKTKEQAHKAIDAYPKGLQIGGGINDKNAKGWIEAGASHVIVTSFVFNEGRVNMDRLRLLNEVVAPDNIVLDLSVKKVGDYYHVATERWQNISDEPISIELFGKLSQYCGEFLVHAVDIEGQRNGIDEDLVKLLGEYDERIITYAGGIRSIDDIEKIKDLGHSRLDFTIGSALDIFGGELRFKDVAKYI